jgi:hypothetical protein
MAGTTHADTRLADLEELAAGWGKLLALEAFPNGPGMDVTLADMEEIAARAAQAIVAGAVSTMAEDQAQAMGRQLPCPTCGRLCEVSRRPRIVAVRGGSTELIEPVAHCSTCRRDFFPSASHLAD